MICSRPDGSQLLLVLHVITMIGCAQASRGGQGQGQRGLHACPSRVLLFHGALGKIEIRRVLYICMYPYIKDLYDSLGKKKKKKDEKMLFNRSRGYLFIYLFIF